MQTTYTVLKFFGFSLTPLTCFSLFFPPQHDKNRCNSCKSYQINLSFGMNIEACVFYLFSEFD